MDKERVTADNNNLYWRKNLLPKNLSMIRSAEVEEYDQIQRYLEDAYGCSFNFFPLSYPTVWRKETTDFKHTYLIYEGRKIVSLVRVFPLPLKLGEVEITVGGIGAVSTLPALRGKGYMAELMKYAISEMKAENIPVSILWGDRHRYQNFGYESAGKKIVFTLSSRGFQKTGIKPVPGIRYQGEKALLKKIISAYKNHPYRKLRKPEEYELLYQKYDLLIFCFGEGEEFGYLGLMGGGVTEFGGNPHTVLRIGAYCMERFGIASLNFFFPNGALVPPPVLQAASSWSMISMGMMKILDLEKTIECFAREKREVGGGGDYSALQKLTEPEQVTTLFGTDVESPFNIFIWPLDHI